MIFYDEDIITEQEIVIDCGIRQYLIFLVLQTLLRHNKKLLALEAERDRERERQGKTETERARERETGSKRGTTTFLVKTMFSKV